MTKIPKTQFINSTIFWVVLLSSFLLGLFTWAIVTRQTPYFLCLTAGLFLSLIYLFFQHNSLVDFDSQMKLKLQDLEEKNNLLLAETLKESQAIEAFRKKSIVYSQLKGLTENLSLSLSLEDTIQTLSQGVNRLFSDHNTVIILYLLNPKTGDLGIASASKGQNPINLKEKKGDFFDEWLLKNMQPLLIEEIKNDYRFDVDRIEPPLSRSIQSLMSVPLIVGTKVLGILRMDHPQENYYSQQDLRFLTTICDVASVAIENAQLYERVEQLAIRDSLTGLYLRRYLQDRLPEEISRQMRNNKSELSFVMVDLDHFKKYNDKFGHVAGDIVLKTVGMILEDMFKKPGNIVCRYGGEEFAILLPDCTKSKAKEQAENLRKRVEEHVILLRKEKTQITVSIGIASFPKDATGKDELIHKADKALYQAKQAGRNKVAVATN